MDLLDPIYASQVPGWPFIYVVGSFDTRITFYSQQVRGLSLAHSFLNTEGRTKRRFAVIGAGAAGLSVSAGLSLLNSEAQIDIFEREPHPLHLQRGCTRRNLHPHIYDWPHAISKDDQAGLPFLNWTAGTAGDVAAAVMQQFGTLQAHRDRRLNLKTLCDVTAIERAASGAYRVYHRPSSSAAEPTSSTYHAIFIAIGFGAERKLSGAPSRSYWSDAGVPGAPRYAADQVSVIVSGAGDGGLIDLCAAALEDFDHTALIDLVTKWPGIEGIEEELISIDREAEGFGEAFDFAEAYERNIGVTLRKDGLIEEVRLRLRQRVKIVFNTKGRLFLQQPTSALNRLLVYLLFSAASDDGRPIQHAPGTLSADLHLPGNYKIEDDSFPSDELYVRHGAAKLEAFAPFEAIRLAYQDHHKKWLASDFARQAPPTLDQTVASAIETALINGGIPVQRAVHDGALAMMPLKAGFKLDTGGNFSWYGDVQPMAMLKWWDSPQRTLHLECSPGPSAHPELAIAIARFIIHARQLQVAVDTSSWKDWLVVLTRKSAHAAAIEGPLTCPIVRSFPALNQMNAPTLAAELNAQMDTWVLDRVDSHLTIFLESGNEPDNWINWEINQDLRREMAERWTGWAAKLRADANLLSRLFRLAACTVEDDPGNTADRDVLVGRLRLPNIVRTVTLALAAAGAWPVSSPRGNAPGNFDRRSADGAEIATIHASGAELIEGRTLTTMASVHAWQTSFVLLSELTAPIRLENSAELSLFNVEDSAVRLDVALPPANVIVGPDAGFLAALRTGAGALTAYLAEAEINSIGQWVGLLDTGAPING